MSDESTRLTDKETQGRLLRRARLAAELTQTDTAPAAALSQRDLARAEHGKHSLSLPHLELLSRAYGVPVTEFWGREPPPVGGELISGEEAQEYLTLRRKMIGVLLRQARLARGRSLNDLAEALDCAPEQVAAFEFGEQDIPFCELEKLAHLCGVPVAHFADPDRLPSQEQPRETLEAVAQMPQDVREFVSQPSNVLYIRLAMLLSELSVDTLRKIGEGLLDITL